MTAEGSVGMPSDRCRVKPGPADSPFSALRTLTYKSMFLESFIAYTRISLVGRGMLRYPIIGFSARRLLDALGVNSALG